MKFEMEQQHVVGNGVPEERAAVADLRDTTRWAANRSSAAEFPAGVDEMLYMSVALGNRVAVVA